MTTHYGSLGTVRRFELDPQEYPGVEPGDFLVLTFSITATKPVGDCILAEVDPCRMVDSGRRPLRHAEERDTMEEASE